MRAEPPQILHSVQDDRTSFCYSNYPLCHSERPLVILSEAKNLFPPLSYSPLLLLPTCVQATIDIRFVWHPVSAHLGNFPDMCAANPRSTTYIQYSLRTSPKMLGKNKYIIPLVNMTATIKEDMVVDDAPDE